MRLKMNNIMGVKVAVVQLYYKSETLPSHRVTIKSSIESAEIFRQYWNDDTIELLEEAKVLFLNRANHVLGLFHLSTGSVDATIMDPRLILTAALLLKANSFIVCHSHPSGNVKPSVTDIDVTRELSKAAKMINIHLLDHIILTKTEYYSFTEEGVIN